MLILGLFIGVGVNGKSYTTILMEQRLDTESGEFSFTKDDVGGDLTDVDVELKLQITNGSTLKKVYPQYTFYIRGEG